MECKELSKKINNPETVKQKIDRMDKNMFSKQNRKENIKKACNKVNKIRQREEKKEIINNPERMNRIDQGI